jgi:tyrosyl-tRNA synthetase
LKEGIEKGKVHPKEAKENLAMEIVERYCSKEEALKVKEEFERIFREKGLPDKIPVVEIEWDEKEMWVPKIMKLSGLTTSTSGAIRTIQQGGVMIDDKKFINPDEKLTKGDYLFKVGKRKFMRVKSKS